MSECLSEGLLTEFVEGHLPPEQVALIHAHIGSCESCRSRLALSLAATSPGESPVSSPSDSQPATDSSPGPGRKAQRIGRYFVLRKLGQGGMGVVYAAFDEELDRKIAIKLLHDSQVQSVERRSRIIREAQAMARVSHPNVVHVYEVGEFKEHIYIAMEFVEGTTLSNWQRDRPWEEVLRVYICAGQGLLAAHRAGLVHRDFKPDNVLVGPDSQPRVADFGLARADGSEVPQATERGPIPSGMLSSPLTEDGMLLGTPAYMSPEQFAGEATDARSDQWSFCAALYQALYGQTPFAGEDLTGLSDNVHHGRLRPVPANSQVPMVISETLRRGLEVAPEDRFPSMAELLAALDIDPQHDPAAAPQLGRVFSLAMLATGGLLSVIIASSLERGTPSLRQLFVSALVLLTGSMLVAFHLREQLGRHHFHRGLVKMVIILTAQMTLLRAVALALGLDLAQAGAMEIVATGGLLATSSVHYLPALWPMTVACVLLAMLIPLFPAAAWAIVGVFYPALGLVFLYALNNAARQVGPRGTVSRLRQRQVRRARQGSYSGQEPSNPSQPQSPSQDSGSL